MSHDIADTHIGNLEQLKAWGLPNSHELKVAAGIEDCLAYYRDIGERRLSLSYEIDGVVFKVNSIASQRERSPGGALEPPAPPAE